MLSASQPTSKYAISFIFITVFLDMLGFGAEPDLRLFRFA